MAELPYDVLAEGEFPTDRVAVTWSDQSRPTTPDLEARIEAVWQQRLVDAQRTGAILFDGPLVRLIDHRLDDDRLHLRVGPTTYREFVGTNLYGPDPSGVERFGLDRFANPLGTTMALVTVDGFIIYGRRSEQVVYHAGYVHTIGGALEPGDRTADGDVDVFSSVVREVGEELGLAADDLTDVVCTGLIRDHEIHQPELLFDGQCRLDRQEVLARWQRAEGRAEHVGIVCLPDQPDQVVPFVASAAPIAPVAVAALMLHGRRRWGPTWCQATSQRLRGLLDGRSG